MSAAELLAAAVKTTAIEKGIDILFTMDFWSSVGKAAKTSGGFFWKSGWAFVLGYFISAMIQAFVPKGRLTPYLGGDDAKCGGWIALAALGVGIIIYLFLPAG